MAVKTKAVPSAVFGSVLGQGQEEQLRGKEAIKKLGALERFSSVGK